MTAELTLGSCASRSVMVGFERIELAGLGAGDGWLIGLVEVFLDGPPTHAEMALDLADGPAFRVIELVQGLDLFRGQHRPFSVFRPKPFPNQRDVVCKMPLRLAACGEVLAG